MPRKKSGRPRGRPPKADEDRLHPRTYRLGGETLAEIAALKQLLGLPHDVDVIRQAVRKLHRAEAEDGRK